MSLQSQLLPKAEGSFMRSQLVRFTDFLSLLRNVVEIKTIIPNIVLLIMRSCLCLGLPIFFLALRITYHLLTLCSLITIRRANIANLGFFTVITCNTNCWLMILCLVAIWVRSLLVLGRRGDFGVGSCGCIKWMRRERKLRGCLIHQWWLVQVQEKRQRRRRSRAVNSCRGWGNGLFRDQGLQATKSRMELFKDISGEETIFGRVVHVVQWIQNH